MIDFINTLIGPLHNRVMLMISRATLNSVADGAPAQITQATVGDDDTKDPERISEYGFTSVPLPGAQGVAVFVGGLRDHGLIIATGDRRYRLTGLAGGEVAIHDDQGQKVHITRDGIVIHTAKKVRVECEDMEMHASHSWSWDVDGFGERWTSLGGGTYEHRTWQEGATVTTVPGPINPPEGP